jgi:hypothetical protein
MFRKISIGVDYKDAMHYTVGQHFGNMTIEAIVQQDLQHYQIWIRNSDNELSLWKEIIGMPCVLEMDLKAYG